MSDEFAPETVLMEANIREFGHTISLIVALEMGGKISSDEAYVLIRKTWKELRNSHHILYGNPGGADSPEDL